MLLREFLVLIKSPTKRYRAALRTTQYDIAIDVRATHDGHTTRTRHTTHHSSHARDHRHLCCWPTGAGGDQGRRGAALAAQGDQVETGAGGRYRVPNEDRVCADLAPRPATSQAALTTPNHAERRTSIYLFIHKTPIPATTARPWPKRETKWRRKRRTMKMKRRGVRG